VKNTDVGRNICCGGAAEVPPRPKMRPGWRSERTPNIADTTTGRCHSIEKKITTPAWSATSAYGVPFNSRTRAVDRQHGVCLRTRRAAPVGGVAHHVRGCRATAVHANGEEYIGLFQVTSPVCNNVDVVINVWICSCMLLAVYCQH